MCESLCPCVLASVHVPAKCPFLFACMCFHCCFFVVAGVYTVAGVCAVPCAHFVAWIPALDSLDACIY